jgi:superfamily I DNA and RNA helicase
LVDSIKIVAPNPLFCLTFHELAKNIADLLGVSIDLLSKDAFNDLEETFLTYAEKLASEFDFLIVDEGQDFKPEWKDLICNMVKPSGRVLWMEDPFQTMYPDRGQSDWSSWVKFKSPINYRSPKVIIDLVNELQLTDEEIVSGSPIVGEVTGLRSYQKNDEESLFRATQTEVQNLLNQGYSSENIAVVTFCGANRSKLLNSNHTQIAGKGIKKLIGYTSNNQAKWSSGEIVIDTIYRFKGLSADAVIITEVDFFEWDQQVKRKLFVALTRARMKVVVVATVEAATEIEQLLN